MSRKFKVLNIDDHESGRYMVSRQLIAAGFEVIEAATGAEGLALMSTKPDVVLLDINLPDISGFEVCRRIRNHPEHSSTIVVHMSATTTASKDKARGLELGADAYLTEPIEAEELIATVRAMIRIHEAETESKRLTATLEAQIVELETQKQMRERFVNALSHDLRGPLSGAQLSAQMLARRRDLPDEAVSLAQRVMKQLGRLNQMIEDLLDANRIKGGEKIPVEIQSCNLSEIANTTMADLTHQYGERFILKIRDSIRGFWDGSAIKRVLENLVSNAIKYGHVDSLITVAAQQLPNGHVELCVHNHGEPIPAHSLNSIFDQYARLTDATAARGWGIGLMLVRAIVEAHGGRVEVRSSSEEGTTFSAFFPNDSRGYSQ